MSSRSRTVSIWHPSHPSRASYRMFKFEEMTDDQKVYYKNNIFNKSFTIYHNDETKTVLTPKELGDFITVNGKNMYCTYGKVTDIELDGANNSRLKLVIGGITYIILISEFTENIYITNNNILFLYKSERGLSFLGIEKEEIIEANLFANERRLVYPTHYSFAQIFEKEAEQEIKQKGTEQSDRAIKRQKFTAGGSKIKKITRKVYLDDKGKSYIKYDNIIIYLKK